MQTLADKKELMDMLEKLQNSKDDIWKLIENAEKHREEMQQIVKCYQESDWMGLQVLMKEMIEKYDESGYGKGAALLMEAGQQAMNDHKDNSSNMVSSLAGKGANLIGQLIMPSMQEFKKLAHYGEKQRLLREIKSATIEKLTNKIIRSFAWEVSFITPFLLITCLQYRQAALTDPTAQCYGDLAMWVLVFFLGFAFFSVLRILRVPILRGLTHNFFFQYSLFVTVAQIVFFASWFFYGNSVFLRSTNMTADQCDAEFSDPLEAAQQHYNPIMLQIIMGTIMLFHWFIFIAIIQLILFSLILWTLWDGVAHAAKKMQQGFSMARVVELFFEAMGEGELQDSAMIGGIQYLMNDESYYCKRCKEPFLQ